MLPNRIATYLLALAGLGGAITPVIANFDTSSTIGWVAGLAAFSTAVAVWLLGWQKYEERTDLIDAGVPGFGSADPGLPDVAAAVNPAPDVGDARA